MVQASLLFFQNTIECFTSIFKSPHFLNRHYLIQPVFLNFKVRTELFRNSFFPYTVNEWNNLGNIIKSSETYLMSRKRMLNLIRPKCNETYVIHHPNGLKLLTRLRLGLSHLSNHKFRDCINPLCSCSVSVENNVYFVLHCHHFSFQRQTLMNNISLISLPYRYH